MTTQNSPPPSLWHHCLNPHSQKPALTFIHGWASDSQVWLPFAKAFCDDFQVHLLDLPGFGQSPPLSLDTKNGNQIAQHWNAAILQTLPAQTHLIGWSLGGLLAQRLIATAPHRILSLINLASTPKFVQTENWPFAVSPRLMKDFIQAVSQEYGSLLKQFWRLQFQGSDDARKWMKRLQTQMQNRSLPSLTGLLQGLYILKDLDNRPLCQTDAKTENHLPKSPAPPMAWLLGEKDPLIPLELNQSLIANFPMQIIQGAGHMPFFSHPQETEKALQSLFNQIQSLKNNSEQPHHSNTKKPV